MQKPTSCPKCGGSFTEGFVVDETYGAHGVSAWVEGAPVKRFWAGIKVPEKIEIRTYRCNRCGYLESYAAA
jgi:predicted nucleic-acid-binding Zn-ribbon protein